MPPSQFEGARWEWPSAMPICALFPPGIFPPGGGHCAPRHLARFLVRLLVPWAPWERQRRGVLEMAVGDINVRIPPTYRPSWCISWTSNSALLKTKSFNCATVHHHLAKLLRVRPFALGGRRDMWMCPCCGPAIGAPPPWGTTSPPGNRQSQT